LPEVRSDRAEARGTPGSAQGVEWANKLKDRSFRCFGSLRHFFCGLAQDCFNDCWCKGFEQVLLETGRLAFGQIFDAAIVEAFFEL